MKDNCDCLNGSDDFLLRCIKQLSVYSDLHTMINGVIKMILDFYDAEHVFIYELNEDGTECQNTYEAHSCKSDLPEFDSSMLTEERLDFWRNVFKTSEYIYFNSNAASDEEMKRYSIAFGDCIGKTLKSGVVVALSIDDKRYGSMSVVNPKVDSKGYDFMPHIAFLIANEMQRCRALEKLDYLIYYDALTGIKNRNSFNKYSDDFRVSDAKSAGVMFLDINGLSAINEKFGQKYGDIVIKSIARELSDYKCENSSEERLIDVFRVSGDEFVLVRENCSIGEFNSGVEYIKKQLTKDNENLVTMGVLWSDKVDSFSKIVKKAEDLMYIEKHTYYEKNMSTHSHTQTLLNSVINSLNNGEFVVYLQPKNSILKDGEVYGAEALVRYVDGEKGIISPYKFIKLFEKERIISYVDFFVFEEVCKLLYGWRLLNKKRIIVSLNFSRISLMESDFVERIEKICKKYDVDKSLLELEVTETTEALDRRRMIEVVNELKSKGFRISLDDFGCEYSSMDMLLAFDVDVIKIDKSLIDEITNSNKNKIIVGHICQMGNDMGVETIAEGVETKEQYNLLSHIGCDCVQGYYFGKPMPVSDFESNFLASNAAE